MNEIIKNNSSKFGLITGGLGIAYFLLAYLVDETLFVNMAIGILFWVGNIALFIVAVARSKKQLGGYIAFKEAFSGFMLTAIIYSLLITLFSMLLFNVVDPELAVTLKEATLEKTVEFLESIGQSNDEIEKAIVNMEKVDNYSIANMGKSFIYSVLGYSILGLIVAAIMKKNRPEFPDMEMDNFGEES